MYYLSDSEKSKEELILELQTIRKRVRELEKIKTDWSSPGFDSIFNPKNNLLKKTLLKEKGFKSLRDLGNKKISKFRSEILRVREIQASLLPKFENIRKFDISSSFLPVDDLSGDFIDGFFVEPEIYQLILCDVSGHGISSSYVGSSIRSIFRSISKEKTSPGHFIEKVNDMVASEYSRMGFFATVAICQIDILNDSIIYAAGGHPPSFFIKKVGSKCEAIEGTGPLIGMERGMKFEDKKIVMTKGDGLLLYTDGVIDAQEEHGTQRFGENRLIQAFMDHKDRPSIEILHNIINRLFLYTNYSGQEDDISLVCIKKT